VTKDYIDKFFHFYLYIHIVYIENTKINTIFHSIYRIDNNINYSIPIYEYIKKII